MKKEMIKEPMILTLIILVALNLGLSLIILVYLVANRLLLI